MTKGPPGQAGGLPRGAPAAVPACGVAPGSALAALGALATHLLGMSPSSFRRPAIWPREQKVMAEPMKSRSEGGGGARVETCWKGESGCAAGWAGGRSLLLAKYLPLARFR